MITIKKKFAPITLEISFEEDLEELIKVLTHSRSALHNAESRFYVRSTESSDVVYLENLIYKLESK